MEGRSGMEKDSTSIGTNCYFSAIASALEHLDHLEVMLGLTAFDFTFKDPESFTLLDVSNGIEDYLSPVDTLVFEKKPQSFFRNAMFYLRDIWDEQDTSYAILPLEISNASDFVSLCLEYTRQNIPIILELNVAALKHEYKRIGALVPRGRAAIHMINLLDVDHESCRIIDAQFRANGRITTDSIMHGMSYVKPPSAYAFTLSNSIKTKKHFMIEHMTRSVYPQLVNGVTYESNKSLTNFVNDFSSVVDWLYNRYEKFMYPAFSYILYPHRLERRGCSTLYAKFSTLFDMPEWQHIIGLAKKSGELWYALDMITDKCFLKDESADYFKQAVSELIKEIYRTDSAVLDNMKKILEL